MEITKMLTLSTCHIKEETAMLLNDACIYKKEFSLVLYPKRWISDYYGWFIYIPEELEADPETYEDVPKDLMQCLLFAKHVGCELLCLDGDREVLSYLDKYNW